MSTINKKFIYSQSISLRPRRTKLAPWLLSPSTFCQDQFMNFLLFDSGTAEDSFPVDCHHTCRLDIDRRGEFIEWKTVGHVSSNAKSIARPHWSCTMLPCSCLFLTMSRLARTPSSPAKACQWISHNTRWSCEDMIKESFNSDLNDLFCSTW